MPAVPIILGAAAAAGVASTIGTAIVASITTATISASVATAIGTGVIAGGLTAIQGGSSNDILKSAVLSGIGSYVGGQVASKVTSTVAANTGASLVDLEPALRELSKEGITAGGVAAITAGNVAGQAVNAAITGRPIEDAALLGLATSIPTALTASKDFQSLDRVAQNVIASSLQASALGTDVGTAALTSLVSSSEIVAKAIKQIPDGEEFIKQNPIFAKYIVDSVSSALVAKLSGADVTESVIASLARTTGDVLAREFQNAQNSQSVTEARQKNDEAIRLQQQAAAARDELTQLLATNKRDVDNLNNLLEAYPRNKETYDQALRRYNGLVRDYDRLNYDAEWRNYITQRASLEGLSAEQFIARDANQIASQLETYSFQLDNNIKNLNRTTENLQNNGFFDNYDRLVNNIKTYDAQYTTLVRDVNVLAENLSSTSASLFNDFVTELETTLAPLTAFQDETVPDQDILAEIQPVAPPTELLAGGNTSQLPVEDQELLKQIQDVAQRPDITGQEGSTELAGPQAPSFIDFIDRQNERLVGGPQLSTETDGGVTINSYRQPVVGTLPDGRQYTYNIVIDVDTGERFYEYSTEIPSGQELVADTSVVTASRNKPDFQAMYAEPGAGAGGDLASDIENIIRGDGLVPEEIVEVSQPSPVIPELQVPIVVPREPEPVVAPTEQPTIVEPTQPPPVIQEPIPEVPTGEVTDQEIKDVIDQQTPTIVGEEGEAPVTPTLPGGIGESTVGGGDDQVVEIAPTPIPEPLPEAIPDEVIPELQPEPQPEPIPEQITEDEIAKIIEEELFGPTPTTPEEPIAEPPVVEEEIVPPAEEEVLPEEPVAPPVVEEEVVPPILEEPVEPSPVEEEIQLPTPVQPEPEVLPPELPEEVTQEEIENIIAEELFGPQVPPTEELPVEPPLLPIELEQLPIDLPGAGEEVIGIPDGVPSEEGAITEEGEGGAGFEPEAQEPGFEGEPEAPIATPEEDEDQAILDLIRDLEQEEGLEEVPVEEEPLFFDEEGMEEIPLEPETPVEEVVEPTRGTRPIVTLVPRQRSFQRPGEAAPYRVTGQDESGILGRKQPLFGGDEDLQRAEWNRRSLRLKRLLGL